MLLLIFKGCSIIIDMQAFIFDLYNTLIDIHTDEHREQTWEPVVDYFAEHGMRTSAQRLSDGYDRYWRLFLERAQAERRYSYPECDAVAVFESMARGERGKLTREQAAEALKIMRRASIVRMRLFDGTLELLRELKRRGASVYLLSNAQSAFTPDEIAECGLSDMFDGVMLSSDYGVRKPDPEYFGLLIDKYGIDVKKAVMVGDDMQNDVYGAQRLGMTGVWAGGGAAAHASEILALCENVK